MLDIGFKTDVGMVRTMNQDSIYVPKDIEIDIPIFIVADGMGGYKAGNVASEVAIEGIMNSINSNFISCPKNRNSLSTLIRKSVQFANNNIYQKAKTSEEFTGMGTTVNLLMFYNNKVYVANVGDSRAYVIRKNKIFQMTRDHSYVEQLVRKGEITKEEAKKHPQKNIITKALGTEGYIDVDIYVRTLFNKDIYVVCSDGLTNMLSNEEIKEIALSKMDSQKIVDELVKMANGRGGKDNISAIVIKNI